MKFKLIEEVKVNKKGRSNYFGVKTCKLNVIIDQFFGTKNFLV